MIILWVVLGIIFCFIYAGIAALLDRWMRKARLKYYASDRKEYSIGYWFYSKGFDLWVLFWPFFIIGIPAVLLVEFYNWIVFHE